MTKTLMTAFALFIVTLTVTPLAYPNDIASARKLISATRNTNYHGVVCRLTDPNHISTSHTTSYDGNVCQMLVCITQQMS